MVELEMMDPVQVVRSKCLRVSTGLDYCARLRIVDRVLEGFGRGDG